jgi:hypothetical protein
MTMTPLLRKLTLTLHVACSVSWLGAATAYLAVAIRAVASGESAAMRAAYPTLELVGWLVIVPLCGAALLSGLVQSLGTPWGLFRHYWVVAKLALTLVATGVLLSHLPAVSHAATLAARPMAAPSGQGMAPAPLVVHAAGGMVVLLGVTALSVFKPWGLTPLGRRWQRAVVREGAAKPVAGAKAVRTKRNEP